MNLVTVIVPTYNTSKYIKKCIDSILNQTFKNIELIVIDDGSTDNTKDIIEKVNDKRLKYVYKENGGVSSARNLGIDLSTGNYIMFVDSDDYIDKDFIEVVHNYATKTECDIVRCGYRNITLDGKVINEVKYPLGNIIFNKDSMDLIMKNIFFGYGGGIFLKKDIIKNVRFDTSIKFAEDIKFICECFANGNSYGYVDYVGYNYLYNDNSMTKKSNVEVRVKECIDNVNVFESLSKYCNDTDFMKTFIFKRLNMKLKYLIKTTNINYKEFLEIMSYIYEKTDIKMIQVNLNSLKSLEFNDRFLTKLLIQKKYRFYFIINKIYYKIKR